MCGKTILADFIRSYKRSLFYGAFVISPDNLDGGTFCLDLRNLVNELFVPNINTSRVRSP